MELFLCKMYGCRPSELAEEDWDRVLLHYEIDQALHKIDGFRQKDARSKVPLGIHVDVVWEIMKLEGTVPEHL